MEAVDNTRNDADSLNTQPPEPGQANYSQAGLASYTPGNTVPNGTEQVGLGGVPQVMENRPQEQSETHVGLGNDRHGHTSLSISNVPGGVQVAVVPSVPSSDDVSVVDGNLSSGSSGVDRSDGTPSLVTAMPAEYGLPGPLSTPYVIQHDAHEGERY